MKRLIADGSVGFPHVRVGHRQVFIGKGSAIGGAFLVSDEEVGLIRPLCEAPRVRLLGTTAGMQEVEQRRSSCRG